MRNRILCVAIIALGLAFPGEAPAGTVPSCDYGGEGTESCSISGTWCPSPLEECEPACNITCPSNQYACCSQGGSPDYGGSCSCLSEM